MEKKNKKRAKNLEAAKAGKEPEEFKEDDREQTGYSQQIYKVGSPKFDEYYKTQFKGIVDDQEYELFVKTL